MIERSLLPSVPVGSGRHVMRLGHGGERAVGRATGGAVPAVTMSMTMEVVAAAAVVVAAAGVEEDRGGRRGTTVESATVSLHHGGSKRLWAHIVQCLA